MCRQPTAKWATQECGPKTMPGQRMVSPVTCTPEVGAGTTTSAEGATDITKVSGTTLRCNTFGCTPSCPEAQGCLMALITSSLPLTDIVNLSLQSGIFTTLLKSAQLSLILKKANLDSDLLSKYHPISNLNYICKLVE